MNRRPLAAAALFGALVGAVGVAIAYAVRDARAADTEPQGAGAPAGMADALLEAINGGRVSIPPRPWGPS